MIPYSCISETLQIATYDLNQSALSFCHCYYSCSNMFSMRNLRPLMKTRQVGTMVEVKTPCPNRTCSSIENDWRSQPGMKKTRTPAGNLLLCFAILVAGGSANKVSRAFQHMVLGCIPLTTFFKHQRAILEGRMQIL